MLQASLSIGTMLLKASYRFDDTEARNGAGRSTERGPPCSFQPARPKRKGRVLTQHPSRQASHARTRWKLKMTLSTSDRCRFERSPDPQQQRKLKNTEKNSKNQIERNVKIWKKTALSSPTKRKRISGCHCTANSTADRHKTS